jgi:hypothetical protein
MVPPAPYSFFPQGLIGQLLLHLSDPVLHLLLISPSNPVVGKEQQHHQTQQG